MTHFYPVGNTSAVCLTENLPPETKADVLLLACGDPRHILYTIYANETSPSQYLQTFDITCCDVDAAVLARNALLFTLLADDDAQTKLDDLWNLFYHIFIDKHVLSVLLAQCRKLVRLAESTETWRAGPYGHFLTTCDAATLAQLRRIWDAYLKTAGFSPKQAKRFKQRFTDELKEVAQRSGCRGTTTAARSAGPFSLFAARAVSSQFRSYWSSGITSDSDDPKNKGPGQEQHSSVNPTFAFSIDGDKCSIHYGTDPLTGFHLAEAFTSGTNFDIQPREMVRIARNQFSRWCTSVSKRLKHPNTSSSTFVIRMYAGDALGFCQALRYCEVTKSPITPYDVAAWRLSTISLDDHYYGRGAPSPAPLSFNVIDTSNVLDHIGLLNILVVTAPLLRGVPSATLYTEGLLRTGDDPSQDVLEHVCGDIPTMALLLGVVPSTFISQFTTRSNAHEALTMDEDTRQYHERLAWKALGGESAQYCENPRSPLRPCFSPTELAAFFFRVYVSLFPAEDIQLRFQLLTFSPEHMMRKLQLSGILHYNRRSFALLVHLIKTRVETDWHCTMDLFEDLVLADSRLITGQHAYHELCCQLHLLGVYTPSWLSDPDPSIWGDDVPRLFRDWTPARIPPVVTLALVVPREAIALLECDFKDVGTPVLHCDMHDGPRQLWFAVISATFGTLHISGKGENQVGIVVEGDADLVGTSTNSPAMRPLWRTGAPLIATFSIPSRILMNFGQNPGATVGLALHPTFAVSIKFAGQLGFDLTVFRTRLTDVGRVFVLARRPVLGSSEDGDTVMTGHWQGPEQPNVIPEVPRGGSTDVRVQMNDMASAMQSMAVRVDITDPSARVALADAKTVPTIGSTTASSRTLDACVKIGTHVCTVRFPLPVDIARAKLRVARRSSYIEVVAPPAMSEVRPERDLSSHFASLSLDPDDDGSLALGSIQRVNLDRLPTLKYSKDKPARVWYDLHIGLMFSKLERQRMHREIAPSGVLSHVKQTLHALLSLAAGSGSHSGGPERVVALFDTSSRCAYLYIVVACLRLDVGSHTVVADAFVAPSTPAVRTRLNMATHASTSTKDDPSRRPGTRLIHTDADETLAWFHLLPRLVERCRTWFHKTTCAYRATAQREHDTPKTWKSQSPLCSCGTGVDTKGLPQQFKLVAPYLTRAAFSPLFSVPYLKELDTQGPATGNAPGKNVAKCQYRPCGREGGLTCGRCKRAKYCSEMCQRADWKSHKKDCKDSVATSLQVPGSDLA